MALKSFSYYLEEFKKVHGNNFDYSNSVYKGAREHITFKCKICNSEINMTPDNHRRGKGCKTCLLNSKRSNTEEFISKAMVLQPHYDYSRVDYKNSITKVCIGCSNKEHGFFLIKPNNFLNGQGCKKCAVENKTKLQLKGKEHFYKKVNPEFLDFFEIKEFNYEGIEQKLTCICPIHGEFNIKMKYTFRNGWCRSCNHSCSFKERELFLWIKKYFPSAVQHYRPSWLKLYGSRRSSEIDIYIPELNLGIEYNGQYSHSEEVLLLKDKPNYHKEKYISCLQNNINLIHIFEFEDLNKWKRKLKLYFENLEKYKISFKNNKRSVRNKRFVLIGQSFIKLKN